LVIGDAALKLAAAGTYAHRYDLGEEWKRWTGKPFVFAVVGGDAGSEPRCRAPGPRGATRVRAWGLAHLDEIARETAS